MFINNTDYNSDKEITNSQGQFLPFKQTWVHMWQSPRSFTIGFISEYLF